MEYSADDDSAVDRLRVLGATGIEDEATVDYAVSGATSVIQIVWARELFLQATEWRSRTHCVAIVPCRPKRK